MVSPFVGAKTLDVAGWIYGLVSAGISSFGGAIAAGFGPAIVDPKDFNFQSPGLMIKTALIGAALAGIVSMAKFLSTQPLPAVKEVTTTVKTLTPATPTEPVTITTVQEKHVEPIAPVNTKETKP